MAKSKGRKKNCRIVCLVEIEFFFCPLARISILDECVGRVNMYVRLNVIDKVGFNSVAFFLNRNQKSKKSLRLKALNFTFKRLLKLVNKQLIN